MAKLVFTPEKSAHKLTAAKGEYIHESQNEIDVAETANHFTSIIKEQHQRLNLFSELLLIETAIASKYRKQVKYLIISNALTLGGAIGYALLSAVIG
jgi:hypothetical protein